MDSNGLLELYDAHARELLGFFARRTGDAQVSLDLLGETFLSAFEQRRRCRGRTERERAAWLYRIAANKLTDHYRRTASERRALDRLGGELRRLSGDEVVAIEQLAERHEYADRLGAALDGLSEEQRHAIQLRVLDEHPYPVVSHELGISEPAARARVSRGLRTLLRSIAASERTNHD